MRIVPVHNKLCIFAMHSAIKTCFAFTRQCLPKLHDSDTLLLNAKYTVIVEKLGRKRLKQLVVFQGV